MSELSGLKEALAALESQRSILGDAIVDAASAPIKARINSLEITDNSPQERRKIITILFADVSGFTAMSEKMDAEEIRETMNELWKHVDQCVIEKKGKIDKHIGDAIMALFGAERSSEHDAEAAIDAALDMQKAVKEFNLKKKLPVELKMRIGINTGNVLLGAVGVNQEFTAMGDAVNLASRLEHAAPVGGILVSHDTYRHIQGVYNVISQAPLAVKGKVEPVRTYIIQTKKDKAFRLKNYNFEGLEIKMLGRDRELQVLKDAFFDSFNDPGFRIISISGETGIGKSRLLYEFRSWMQLEPLCMRTFQGRCLEQNKSRSYSLLGDIFSNRFHIFESDSSAVSNEKFVKGIREFMGVESEEQAHFIGHLIGLNYKDSPYLKHIIGDARQIHNIALHYLMNFFEAITESKANGPDKITPVEIIIEDIQWIDKESLDVIFGLTKNCDNLPFLLIFTASKDFMKEFPIWESILESSDARHSQISLQPLNRDDSQELISNLFRFVTEQSQELSALIIDKSGGNPFYMEELVRMLIDEGIIIKGEEGWKVQDYGFREIKIPHTLSGIVQTRLDRLSIEERETLNRAAIFGYRFWDQGVISLDPNISKEFGASDEGKIQTLIDLKDRELVLSHGKGSFLNSKEFTFCHSLFYEVTYESVLLKHRKVMHEQAAQWIISSSGDRVRAYSSMIADHFAHAQNYEKACIWMGQAIFDATARFALDTAILHYRSALELFAQLIPHANEELKGQRSEWMLAIAEVLRMKARHQEAVEIYLQIIKEKTEEFVVENLPENDFNAILLVKAYNGYANVCESQGRYQLMIENAEHANRLIMKLTSYVSDRMIELQIEKSAALYYHGKALLRLGKIVEAQQFAVEALRIAKEVHAPREIGNALNLSGLCFRSLGQLGQATAYYEEALGIERQRCDRNHEAAVLNNLADIKCNQGDFYTGVILFQEAKQLCRAIGMKDVQLVLLANLGWALQEIGDYVGAVEADKKALQLAGDQMWQFRPFVLSTLSSALAQIGSVVEASDTVWEALQLGMELNNPEFIAYALKAAGIVASKTDDLALRVPENISLTGILHKNALDILSPDELFTRACVLFDEIGATNEKAMSLVAYGHFLDEMGRTNEAEDLKRQALDIFKAAGATDWIGRLENF